MTNTTISISKKFHEWLKSKGDKGDSYEKIITKLLKTNIAEEYEKYEFKAIEKKVETESIENKEEHESIENKEELKTGSNNQQASSQNEPESKKDKPEADIIDSLFEGKMD